LVFLSAGGLAALFHLALRNDGSHTFVDVFPALFPKPTL
jgi:hypothetical protein